MTSMHVQIELLSDAALTETSATVGGHRSLAYVPGSTLLGAFARDVYSQLDEATAFRIFHSGEVRFGAGLPVGAEEVRCVPMPLSFHVRKGSTDGKAFNLARSARAAGVQYVQKREGFIDAKGQIASSQVRSSMRTAINAGGMAREGFLFTIAALAAGGRFLSEISARDDADLQRVREWIGSGREIGIGRSRQKEFGRALVTLSPRVGKSASGTAVPGTATFLAISDLAFRSPETGAPATVPSASDFGLEGDFRFDPSTSFLRYRVYSPFNGARRRPDLERQVLQAGSVISFRSASGALPSNDAVLAVVGRGVGEYKAEGLGSIAFEPEILAGEEVEIRETHRDRSVSEVAPPEHELVTWLQQQEAATAAGEKAWVAAQGAVENFARGLPASQWGEVRALAREHQDRVGLAARLRQHLIAPESKDAKRSVRHGEKRWGRKVGAGVTLGQALVQFAERHDARAVELLAIHVARRDKARKGAK